MGCIIKPSFGGWFSEADELPSTLAIIHPPPLSTNIEINARVASDADEVAAASFPREFDDSEHNGHGAETRRERQYDFQGW